MRLTARIYLTPYFCFWIRFFGYGFSISHGGPILFSERAGIRKCFRLFGVKFECLPKSPSGRN